jgi:glycosyltransferase involved in cell wall biosynthesis
VRVLMVSHSAVIGGSNAVMLSLLRHRPVEVEDASIVFLQDGPLLATADPAPKLIEHARFRSVWAHAGTVRRLREEIRARRADLVFAHFPTAHLFAGTAARRDGIPCLWWQHATYEQAPVLNQLAGRLRAGAVICSGEQAASEQRRRFPRTPVVAVHPGIEPDGLRPPHEHVASESVVLGVLGRLQRLKRVELALRAMPHVLREAPGAVMRIIGSAAPGLDEDYEADLRAEARALGVADHVEFLGHVDGPSALAGLDVLVHCAEVESFGLVAVEALAHGVPVVGADSGGLRETVRNEVDGILLDPTDAAALAAAIVSLATSPARRAEMGAAGRERVLTEFTTARTAQRAWRVAAAVRAGRDPVAALAEPA